MAGVLAHVFVSTKSDDTDPTKIQPSSWNDFHAFVGSVTGAILTRDASDLTYGAAWLAPAAIGKVLASNGASAIPVYTDEPALKAVKFAGGAPGAPVDLEVWVEDTGVTPNNILSIKIRKGGVSYTIATITI